MWAFNVIYFLVLLIQYTDALTAQQQKECLDAHNALRKLHGVPMMSWDNELSREAQKWADHLADNVRSLVHTPKAQRSGQGENLYYAGHSGCDVKTCADAVHAWYMEYKNYNYNTHSKINPNGQMVGHFTQLIWRASTQLGMGIAVRKEANGNTDYYIAARYRPQGNLNSMRMGESKDQGRIRNWEANVPRRLPGTSVPSAKSLRNGEYADSCGQVGDCKDILANQCKGKEMYCNERSPSILKYCKKTCNLCGKGNGGSGNGNGGSGNSGSGNSGNGNSGNGNSGACKDELPNQCKGKEMYCNERSPTILQYCKKTCKLCGKNGGNNGSGNQGNKNCRDGNRRCPSYKRHCNSPGNVAQICKKTCGRC